MKKRLMVLVLVTTMLMAGVLSACSSKESDKDTKDTSKAAQEKTVQKNHSSEKKKVVLNEVAHSIFYAPMYIAIEEGYFAEEGIDLELVTGFGADKTMTAVLGGRKGGMPEMVFEYILKQHKIDPEKDLTINQNIDFGSTAAAFSEGQADFTVEFEPGATNLEKEGKGYVVASLGTDSGYVPYTAFSAKQSYIDKNPEIIQGFTNALQKGMNYVQNHTPEEIAKIIEPQFKETDLDTITTIVTRYYEQDTWKDNLVFEEESFQLLQDILKSAGELTKEAPYEDLVITTHAENAK